MASRRGLVGGGGGSAYSSGGSTVNIVPKGDGASKLADSSITDDGTTVTTAEILNLTHAGNDTNAIIRVNSTAAQGMMLGATGTSVGLQVNATNWMLCSSNTAGQVQVPSTGIIGWSSSTTYASAVCDTILTRKGAGNIRLGATDLNGSPVAQTLSVQNAITGSNLAGANWTLASGLGTGTGTVGQFIVTGADSSVASGTTAQTGIIRCVLNATKALTTGAATTLVSIPLASLQMTGGYISVYMEATDGTNQATRCEEIYYAAENSAGVFVTSAGVVGTGVTAATATKTLTATYALTSANPALLQVTPTLTGITATRFTCVYEVHNLGNTNPTV